MTSPPNYPPPPTHKRGPRPIAIVGIVLACFVIACGLGVVVVGLLSAGQDKAPAFSTPTYSPSSSAATSTASNAPTSSTPTKNTSATPTIIAPTKPPAAAPAPAKVVIDDGTWTIGEDFPPGRYLATGTSSTCYWEIDKSGTNGDDVIKNGFGPGNLRVTLKAGQDFRSQYCGTWVKQ